MILSFFSFFLSPIFVPPVTFVSAIRSFSSFLTALVTRRPKLHRGSNENLTYDDLSGRTLSYVALTASPIHLSNFL